MYICNNRKLLNEINNEVILIKETLNKEKVSTADLFSGSGIVARLLKQHSTDLYANDLEEYSYIINDCYLTNSIDFNEEKYNHYYLLISNELKSNLIEGIITKEYAPNDDNNIQEGERVFYTNQNAKIIDTIRNAIDKHVDDENIKSSSLPLFYMKQACMSIHLEYLKDFIKVKKLKKENLEAMEKMP